MGVKTWSLTLRKESWLREFENRVLRKIFGPKRDEVTGEWRELYNEVLNDLHSSTNTIRLIKSRTGWAGYVARVRENISAYRVLVGKPEGKRPRRGMEDNIQMDLKEVGCGHGLD
jgi:hypothetical protein